jgi:TfoX/Sxy family transcriptional regulator of competence genes
MAYDETLAAALRGALAGEGAVSERRMFGGLCFMLGGHMVAGTFRDRGMVRIGKPNEAEALALPHTAPMSMAGRPMPGIVEVEAAAVLDPAIRERLLALAVGFVRGLPPKPAVRSGRAASARR